MALLTERTNIPYMMEDPSEGRRLAAKVDAESWVKTYVLPILNVQSPHILDIGCGSGALTLAMARMIPDSNVIGLDGSEERLEEAKGSATEQGISNIQFFHSDAQNFVFEDNSFDLVCSRFLFEYLKEPQSTASEMMRVCRPGGKVFIQDIDYQYGGFYPEDDFPDGVFEVLNLLKEKQIFNPNIGRALYTLLHRSGLKKISASVEGYDVVAGEITPESLSLLSWQMKILQPVLEEVLGSKEEAELIKGALIKYLQREDTFSFSLLVSVVGEKVICRK